MTTHSRMARNSSLKELWLARILKEPKSLADGGEVRRKDILDIYGYVTDYPKI